jgi:hypothetical protein
LIAASFADLIQSEFNSLATADSGALARAMRSLTIRLARVVIPGTVVLTAGLLLVETQRFGTWAGVPSLSAGLLCGLAASSLVGPAQRAQVAVGAHRERLIYDLVWLAELSGTFVFLWKSRLSPSLAAGVFGAVNVSSYVIYYRLILRGIARRAKGFPQPSTLTTP